MTEGTATGCACKKGPKAEGHSWRKGQLPCLGSLFVMPKLAVLSFLWAAYYVPFSLQESCVQCEQCPVGLGEEAPVGTGAVCPGEGGKMSCQKK